MGSIVIFRISSCPPLFVVYQYHTCNWFYFSYFLLYYPAPRYYITLEVAIRNISLMYRGIQPDMYNPMKIDMYDSIFRKFVAKGLKYPGYSYLETIINNEAPSFYIEKRQFVRIINDKLKRK